MAMSQVDKMLLGFINAGKEELASNRVQLSRERDGLDPITGNFAHCDRIIVACDAIGYLRFDDEWEAAKTNAETLEIA